MEEIGDPLPRRFRLASQQPPDERRRVPAARRRREKKRREGAAGTPLSYQETALQTLGDLGLHVVHVKKTKKKKALRTRRARSCNKTAEQTRAGGRAGDRKQPFGRREGRRGMGGGVESLSWRSDGM